VVPSAGIEPATHGFRKPLLLVILAPYQRTAGHILGCHSVTHPAPSSGFQVAVSLEHGTYEAVDPPREGSSWPSNSLMLRRFASGDDPNRREFGDPYISGMNPSCIIMPAMSG
jgi:hypothetical protein